MQTTNFSIATALMNIAAKTIGPRVQVTEFHSYLQEDGINIEINYIHINKNGTIFNGIQELKFSSGMHFDSDNIDIKYIDSGVQEIELGHHNTIIGDDETLIVTLDPNKIPNGSIVIPEIFSFSLLRRYFYIYDSFTARADNTIVLDIDRYKSATEGLNKKPKIKLRVFKPSISK